MSLLYACGKNDYYEYGSSQTKSDTAVLVDVFTNDNILKDKVIKEITCGINYGFVITSDNELYGFGNNPNGNLGYPNIDKPLPPTYIIGNCKSVFANNNKNNYFTFFIDNNNKLYAAGQNTNGNLGTGFDNAGLSPCKYKDNYIDVYCINITFNDYYSVMINSDNKLYWCGKTSNSTTEKFFVPIIHDYGDIIQVCINYSQTTDLFLLYKNGNVFKTDAQKFFLNNKNDIIYEKLYFYDEKVKKLSICTNNLGALTVDGNIYVWGYRGYGHGVNYPKDPTKIKPEENPDSNTKFIDVIAGLKYSLALTEDGEIYSCSNNFKPIGNITNTTGYFYPIYLNGLLPGNITASKIALGLDTFLAISDPNAACFNEGTKILCLNCKLNGELNGELNEIYRPVQDLQVGDFVKSYLHGYRKVNKILTGSFVNNPTEDGVPNCMYMMVKTEDNQLIDDLILTRNHGILVEKLSENEEKKVDKNNLPVIDNLLSIITADSDKFEKVMDNNVYKYYHFSLETDGDNDRRFGVYANGLLVEIPSINMMNNALNIKPLDF